MPVTQTVTRTFTFTVYDFTLPPIPDRVGDKGQQVSFRISPPSDGLEPYTISAAGMPPGLTFTPPDLFSGTISASAGKYTVTVSASDARTP